jgi:hypothetical protein
MNFVDAAAGDLGYPRGSLTAINATCRRLCPRSSFSSRENTHTVQLMRMEKSSEKVA